MFEPRKRKKPDGCPMIWVLILIMMDFCSMGYSPPTYKKGACSAGNSVSGTFGFVVRPPCPLLQPLWSMCVPPVWNRDGIIFCFLINSKDMMFHVDPFALFCLWPPAAVCGLLLWMYLNTDLCCCFRLFVVMAFLYVWFVLCCLFWGFFVLFFFRFFLTVEFSFHF